MARDSAPGPKVARRSASRTGSTLVASSPFEPYLSSFVDSLRDDGLASKTVQLYRDGTARFSRWATRQGLLLSAFDEDTLTAFCADLDKSRRRGGHRAHLSELCPVRHFLRFLRERGLVPPEVKSPLGPPLPALLQEFVGWMSQHRGLQLSTLELYCRSLREMLVAIGDDPRLYAPASLRSFLLEYQQHHGSGCAQDAITAMRGFLRFLSSTGKCKVGLEFAIPSIVRRKVVPLPRYLPAADAERVLASCDGTGAAGLRDRAALLLLARLALRGGDIVKLRLEDIDWEAGTLRLSGKGRREIRLPLTDEVGKALAAYITDGRPRRPVPEVFLRAHRPFQPWKTSGSLSSLVAKYIHRAGVKSRSRGAHVLRHSAATELLRQGASLHEIGALLRHRRLSTTEIYAKVDIALLKLVAQPWPEVPTC